MTDAPSDIEARLSALELLVAFLFASQHMQTADPGAALTRLQLLLPDAALKPAPARGDATALADAVDRLVERVAELQDSLPKRLVD